jgi:fucose permease
MIKSIARIALFIIVITFAVSAFSCIVYANPTPEPTEENKQFNNAKDIMENQETDLDGVQNVWNQVKGILGSLFKFLYTGALVWSGIRLVRIGAKFQSIRSEQSGAETKKNLYNTLIGTGIIFLTSTILSVINLLANGVNGYFK